MSDSRHAVEAWGPVALSGAPILMSLYSCLTFQSGGRFLIDPILPVFCLIVVLLVQILLAIHFELRAVRGIKALGVFAALGSLPAFLIPGFTSIPPVQLALIGVLWGTIALVGRLKGFWWLRYPLEKLSTIASIPEEKAIKALEEIRKDEIAQAIPEYALERARFDVAELLSARSNDGKVARNSASSGLQSLWGKIWAYMIDESGEEEEENSLVNHPDPAASSKEAISDREGYLSQFRYGAEIHTSQIPSPSAEAKEESRRKHDKPKPRSLWLRLLDEEEE